jgi:hypothetical protein
MGTLKNQTDFFSKKNFNRYKGPKNLIQKIPKKI